MHLLYVLIILYIVPVYWCDETDEISTLSVEHHLSTNPGYLFAKRGSISLRSFINNVNHVSYQNERPLSKTEFNELANLARNGGIYRVRIPIKADAQDDFIETFVPACALLVSDLRDSMTLTVDNAGHLLGVHLSTPLSDCHPNVLKNAIASLFERSEARLSFATTIQIQTVASGPVPDTASYIRKLDRERVEKVKAEQGDNRSFIAKYWMYLVPLFFFLVMASNQSEAGAGGGR